MKKYSFLTYHKEYEKFLNEIQELGVIHIIEKETGKIENEELREKHLLIQKLNQAINFLEKRDVESEAVGNNQKGNASDILSQLTNQQQEKENFAQHLAALQKDKHTMEPWGNFRWDSIQKLSEAGLSVKFYTIASREFTNEFCEDLFIEKVNEVSGQVYFILFFKSIEKPEINAEEIRLPEKSLSALNKEISDTEAILEKADNTFDTYASKYIQLLKNFREELKAEISFDKVILNTSKEAENTLMVFEAWVPEDKEEELNSYLEQTSTYYEIAAPEAEDAVPIKLKNNKFAKLYESIGELYTFPNYKELDLTPFFAPFYMLFFGFCLGDAGYGLLIIIATIIGMAKAKPKVKPLFKLGFFLGIATTIMGIVGGTFFGILLHPENHPAGTTFAPWIMKYQKFIVSSDNLMYSALVIGYIQVLFGMFLNAVNRIRIRGFKYAISQFGWNIIVLVTIPAVALNMVGVITPELSKNIALISGIVGGIPAFFYNTPGKNPLLNLGTGLWDAYGVASGLLGDVLSYIRLFALGLSSAILGNVFNSLAMDAGKDNGVFGAIIIVLILAFGHGLNFFMAALGSFVHPLRLTFVEFYKNAGFAGGGKKYEPFSKVA